MAKELFLVIYNLVKLLRKAKSSENLYLYLDGNKIYNKPIVTYEIFILGEEDSFVNVAIICYN